MNDVPRFRTKQRDARFGNAPGDLKDKFAIPSVLYGVWCSASGRLLRYTCRQTRKILVAAYEDETTAGLALDTARAIERKDSLVGSSGLVQPGIWKEIADARPTRKVFGTLLVKPVTIKEIEQEVLCNLHGLEVDGCVVFQCPPERSDVWTEMARVMFR